VPLFGRPLVTYPFALLKQAGFSRVAVNTHWRPSEMRQAAQSEAERLGLSLTVSHEAPLLGTGGVFRRLRDLGLVHRDRPLLVLNGDVLFDLDLTRLLHHHLASGADATMVLRELPPGAGYSPIETDESGRIHRIGKHGTPRPGATPRLFTGVHVLSPAALDRLPEGECGIVETVYAPLIAGGGHVASLIEDGLWLDLGDPAGYLDAHLALLSPDLHLGPLARTGLLQSPIHGVDLDARLAPSARVHRSVVGAGATVGASAQLEECVVWPGATVLPGERLHRTIVTPSVRVAV
jgi:NDP-sugar pyrophosphorylase family protein